MGNTQNVINRSGESDQQSTISTELFSEYDENTINRGTLGRPKPLLKFHSVCGTNIQLLRDGRVARRRESFCKGLAFSNRPISIDEIVCIRLSEVGTNWSGVMRFGVTNVDPASFRDIELPKFACPDLTSKGGYWAKSLAERYSVQNAILHFFVNENGEMYYGVNGAHKGLFLSGINTFSPLWIIVDIYGNSVAVEFVDPAEVQLPRRPPQKSARITSAAAAILETASNEGSPILSARSAQNAGMTASSSANNLLNSSNTTTASRSPSARASPMITASSSNRMRFHNVKGNNVTLQNNDTVAVRKHGEYYLGYVFTERPIRIGERLVILVHMTEDAFSGSLAFGLTSCDPTQVPASRLPSDSDELLERPEYWVCIKDVGAMPQVGDKMTFQVDAAGRVLFSKNDAPPRVIMHVDVSIPLWAFFDLYGSTRKIQILDLDLPVPSTSLGISGADAGRSYRASSEGACSPPGIDRTAAISQSIQARLNRPSSIQWNMDSLRVALPAESSSLSTTPPTQSSLGLPVTSTPNISSSNTTTSFSAPSSSAPFSLGIDPNELAKIRASITLRRLNQQQQALNTEFPFPPSSGSPPTDPTPTSTARPSSTASSTTSSSTLMASDRPLPSLNELLARQRARQANQSPGRPYSSGGSSTGSGGGGSSAFSNRNMFDLFEGPAATANISGASITVCPITSTSTFSSLDISSNIEARGEQQNRRNRAAEFEAAHRSSDENSPNRPGDEAANPVGNDDDRSNECSICMNNRVNAVIYRCGHMCMCFPCAKETHRRSGDCPICRTPIIDVIRCYPV